MQDAQVNSNWVDFTADAAFTDDDGAANAVSAMTYIELLCNTDNAATINSTWEKLVQFASSNCARKYALLRN